jgi:tetratricopeptide (TPR) repeat protein
VNDISESCNAANAYYNKGLGLYKKNQFKESVDEFTKARQDFQKLTNTIATNPLKQTKNTNTTQYNKVAEMSKTGLVKSCWMQGRGFANSNEFAKGVMCYTEAILFTDFNSWAKGKRALFNTSQEKYLNDLKIDPSQPTIEELMDKYARCKHHLRKTETQPKRFCLFQFLQQNRSKNIPKFMSTESWDMLLMEELRAMERIESENGEKNVLIEEKLLILQYLQQLCTKETHPIQFAMFNRKLVALHLVKPNANTLLAGSITLLNNSVTALTDTEERDTLIKDAELGLCLATRGLYKMQCALVKFQEALQKRESSTTTKLTTEQLCTKIQDLLAPSKSTYHDMFNGAIADIKGAYDAWDTLSDNVIVFMEDMYAVLDDIARITDYFGLTSLYIAALSYMDKLNVWREVEVDDVDCKIRLARVYVDTGKTNIARGVLDKVDLTKAKQKQKDEYSLVSAYHNVQIGKIEEAKIAFQKLFKSQHCGGDAYYHAAVANMIESNTSVAFELAKDCLRKQTGNLHNGETKTNFLNGTHEFLRNEESLNYDQCNKAVQAFLLVGHMYEIVGYVHESQYYYNQGLLLSFQTFSRFYVIDFLANLADIEKRKHKHTLALQYMTVCTAVNEAIMLQLESEDIVRVQCILSMCQLAGAYRATEHFDKAKEILQEAKQRLLQVGQRLNALHSPTKMKKTVNEEGFGVSSVSGMITLQEALLAFAQDKKEEGEQKLLSIANCQLPQREKAQVQLLLGNHYRGTPDAASYLQESLELSSFIPTHKPIYCATAKYLIDRPDISAYLSSTSMGITLNHQRREMQKFHRVDDIADKMANMSLVDVEKESVVKAFQEEQQRVKWIDEFTNVLPSNMSVVNLCLSHDDSSIIISRFDKAHAPIVVSIPLEMSRDDRKKLLEKGNILPFMRASKKDEDTYRFFRPSETCASALYDTMHEFDSVLEAINESSTEVDSKTWWSKKEGIDNRLQNMLKYVEHVMFGCWKILLVGEIETELQEKIEMTADTLAEEIRKVVGRTMSTHLIALALSSLDSLSEFELEELLCQTLDLTREEHHGKLTDVVKKFCDFYIRMFGEPLTTLVSSSPTKTVSPGQSATPHHSIKDETPMRSRRAATTVKKSKEVAPKRARNRFVGGIKKVQDLANTNSKLINT